MKPCFFLGVWLISQANLWALPRTNVVEAAAVAAAAERFFTLTRTAVEVALDASTNAGTNNVADLSNTLTVVIGESNKLYQAGFDAKLEQAARRVETVRTQAVALLHEPANKAMAAKLEPQQWLDQIATQKEAGKILLNDLGRLRTTLEELRHWATLLESVAPADQLAVTLRARLTELALEWKRTGDRRPHAEEAKAEGRGQKAEVGRPKAGGSVGVRTPAGMSAGAMGIAQMADAGLSEDTIIAYIERYSGFFGLDADQLIYLRSKVSAAVLCRMLEHDGAMRNRQ